MNGLCCSRVFYNWVGGKLTRPNQHALSNNSWSNWSLDHSVLILFALVHKSGRHKISGFVMMPVRSHFNISFHLHLCLFKKSPFPHIIFLSFNLVFKFWFNCCTCLWSRNKNTSLTTFRLDDADCTLYSPCIGQTCYKPVVTALHHSLQRALVQGKLFCSTLEKP